MNDRLNDCLGQLRVNQFAWDISTSAYNFEKQEDQACLMWYSQPSDGIRTCLIALYVWLRQLIMSAAKSWRTPAASPTPVRVYTKYPDNPVLLRLSSVALGRRTVFAVDVAKVTPSNSRAQYQISWRGFVIWAKFRHYLQPVTPQIWTHSMPIQSPQAPPSSSSMCLTIDCFTRYYYRALSICVCDHNVH